MTAPTDDALEGRAWHLVRGVANAPGTTISARFVDGTASGSTGVNRYRATYIRDGSSLRFGPVSATRMAGEPAATKAEADFIALLGAVERYGVDGDALRLDDARGDEILAFQAAPEVPDALAGRWEVRFVRRGDALVSPTLGTDQSLTFDGAGGVTGSGGINRLRGSAHADGDRLTLGPLISTRMAGAPEAMDEEEAFTSALERVTGARVEGDRLDLLDQDGGTLVQLARGSATT